MRLTNEEIARVFGMYLGCEVIYTSSRANADRIIRVITGVILEPDHDGLQQLIFNYDQGTRDHIYLKDESNPELLLTPLSKITDEHAIEVAKMLNWGKDIIKKKIGDERIKDAALKSGKYITENISNAFNLINTTREWSLTFTASLVFACQYLISKSYAVPLWFGIEHPANGKNAIELGIAIDKTI